MPTSTTNESFDPEGDVVERMRLRPVRQLSSNSIHLLYEEVGYLLNDFEKPVLLADALVPDCPIVGASNSVLAISGYTREEIIGRNCRFLLKDVPECHISRSGRKNLRSMIRMCRLIGLSNMGSTSCIQTNSTHTGETFVNMFAVGLVMLHEHPFLLGVLSPQKEETQTSKDKVTQIRQEQQALIAQIRIQLEERTRKAAGMLAKKEQDFVVPRRRKSMDDSSENPAFYAGALTDRVILLNDRSTVMRREPLEIPNGCVVVSEKPLTRTQKGLFFAVRLEGVLPEGGWNSSWPMLGMTQIAPNEMAAAGYPRRGEWCGKSVCVGGEYQVWSRPKAQHKLYGKEKREDLQSFDGPRPRWQGRATTPWELEEGDVMGMLYEPNGAVHLMINFETVLSIETGKPIEDGNYYALVDCQGQAYELTLLPHALPFVGCVQELSLHPLISHRVVDCAARAAASRAVASCTFSVSIADPSQPDVPLVAVSPAFEEMTGYSCEEVIGRNCRFLNHDCDTGLTQRYELRRSCQTGKPFTSLLLNRTKSGDLFWNLLDLRGLIVAKDVVTGEDIWFLVGIQSDVSHLVDEGGNFQEEAQEKHKKELEEVARHLRQELLKEWQLAVESQQQGLAGDHDNVVTNCPQNFVSVPAASGIQMGPKPNQRPMIALLPNPSWMADEPVPEDISSTFEACEEQKRPSSHFPRLSLSKGCTAYLGVFALGIASVVLAQQCCFKRRP